MAFPLRLVAVLCAALLAGGCQVIDGSSSPIDRSRLLDDMISQLREGRQVTYAADYQLAGGQRATVGQQTQPARVSYGYPGGLMLIDSAGMTSCETTSHPVRCELRTVAPAAAGLPTSFTALTAQGMITEPVLSDLLRVASLQPGAVVEPHDSTIAGQPASCLKIRGLVDAAAPAFEACVLADGVLASFSGDVGGLRVDQALVRVTSRLSPEAFALPDGAQIQDLRQSAVQG
jgi:hypothetical protein